MALTFGQIPFTGRVAGSNRTSGGLPAETFSGQITAAGGLVATSAITANKGLSVQGGAVVTGGLDVSGHVTVRGGGYVSFVAPSNVGYNSTKNFVAGYVPFSDNANAQIGGEGKAYVIVGGEWKEPTFDVYWVNPENPDESATSYHDGWEEKSALSAYGYFEPEWGYIYGALDNIDNWECPEGLTLYGAAMSYSPRGLVVDANDGSLDTALGSLDWVFYLESPDSSYYTDFYQDYMGGVFGTLPGFIQLKASKLFWNNMEIYVDGGVLKVRS